MLTGKSFGLHQPLVVSSFVLFRIVSANTYKRHRCPPEIISYAVWLYHRFNLSRRDIEDLLAERGIAVGYESIRL